MDKLDLHSPSWLAVSHWLHERRERCIESLIIGTANDDKLRGEIRLIDDLMNDSHPKPPPEPTQDTDY
ncbi:hypothetical protein [Vreelandella stevensii]|uniref:hypothetical protein n=1 Tax=Vreelandella stevensii TaxID=502821 RepID=UPI00403B2250